MTQAVTGDSALTVTAASSLKFMPPPDTAEYIYRPVLRLVGGEFVQEYQQIWISQP